MRRKNRKITTWAVLALLSCATVSTGCEPSGLLGANLNLNFIVPLGLNGTPGFYNPFGLVQALVNSLVRATTPGSDGGSGGGAGDGGADPGAIGGVL